MGHMKMSFTTRKQIMKSNHNIYKISTILSQKKIDKYSGKYIKSTLHRLKNIKKRVSISQK